MKRNDKIALERYLKKLSLARTAGAVNPFEAESEKIKRIERAKKDVHFMVSYYFPHYATAPSSAFQVKYATQVAKKPVFNGFCQWGRGLAKSVWNNVFIPFWLWLRGESVYFVLIGNSYDRAKQLLEDLRAELEANPRILHDFGSQQKTGSWESGFFVTKGGFVAQALGMGQSVRGLRIKGLRPNLINCDDIEDKSLNKNPGRQMELVKWIERDLIATMDGNTRRFCYSHNKYAPRMIQTLLQEKHPTWHVSDVAAYHPITFEPTWVEKYPKDYYKEIKETIGVLALEAEYANKPHVEGAIFTPKQIQWTPLPRIDHFEMLVGYWDVAYSNNATSDYNAVRIWGLKNKNFYYIDSFVKQSKMWDAVAYMCDFQQRMPQSATIHWRFESQFWNDAVEQTLQEVQKAYGISLNISRDARTKTGKYDRILRLQPYYQNGRIFYNQAKKAHQDTQVGLAQLFGIEPHYKTHDDAPDADAGAIGFLEKHIYMGSAAGMMSVKSKIKNLW